MSSTLEIMSMLLKVILEKVAKVEQVTSSYTNDILVDESVALADEIMDCLRRFGLTVKPSEVIGGGTALGLKL